MSSRSIPPGLKAELEKINPHSALCLIIEARDGARARFTTTVNPFTLDLGEGEGNEICEEQMNISSVTLEVGLDASFAEVSGALGGQLTEAQVAGGRWDDAEAWLVIVSPDVPGEFAPLLGGKVRESRAEDLTFTLEIRHHSDMLNVELGSVLTTNCTAELGDSRCGFALVPVPATVTAVTDAMRFDVSYVGDLPDDFFNIGKATFTSGALTGVISDNIFDFVRLADGAGSIVLRSPLYQPPEVGDTLDLVEGCDGTLPSCVGYHGDARPFRGFPYLQGSSQRNKYPNPGGDS